MAPLPASAVLPTVAKYLLAAKGHPLDAARLAEAHGAPERVKDYFKRSVAAGSTDGTWGDALGDAHLGASAFFETLRTRSIFARMLSDNVLSRVPFRTRLGVVAAGATAWRVGEGAPAPLTKLALENQALTPIEVAAILVVTDELAADMSAAAQNVVTRELRAAVAAEVDRQFLDIVLDTTANDTPSLGSTAVAAYEDLRLLLASVTSPSDRLLFAAAPDVARMASTLSTSTGASAFPGATPTGGEICGVPFVVSDALASGELALFAGEGLVGALGNIELRSSDEITVEMLEEPTNNSATPAAAEQVSLWQTNSVGMLVNVTFGAERIREDAVARLTGITWGEGES